MKTNPIESKSHKRNNWRLPSKRLLPQLNIDLELNRHNVSIAEFIILAGLIKGNPRLRKKIINSINPVCFGTDLFPQYLFARIVEILNQNLDQKIYTRWVISQIKSYYKEIWNRNPTRRDIHGELFSLAQILNFSPTNEQVFNAIKLRKVWARDYKLI
jgi:hypothetical protein